MKIEIKKDGEEHLIGIPEKIIEMVGWEEGTALKIEIGRDFDLNATTLVITKKS
jgi:antitoxin component of MazEF toxin-antitoxin module|tara:strand:+ start:284 stop:445 length:162 start_codon:yes stop_codon:yes gene_type:complete